MYKIWNIYSVLAAKIIIKLIIYICNIYVIYVCYVCYTVKQNNLFFINICHFQSVYSHLWYN
jgi:hypothetical protein